jgi:hypothetical protein
MGSDKPGILGNGWTWNQDCGEMGGHDMAVERWVFVPRHDIHCGVDWQWHFVPTGAEHVLVPPQHVSVAVLLQLSYVVPAVVVY